MSISSANTVVMAMHESMGSGNFVGVNSVTPAPTEFKMEWYA